MTFFWTSLSNGDVLFGLLQCSLDSLRSSSAKVGSQTVNNYFLSSFSNYFPQTVNNYFLCCGDFVNIPYIQLHLRFCRQKINHYLLNADAVYHLDKNFCASHFYRTFFFLVFSPRSKRNISLETTFCVCALILDWRLATMQMLASSPKTNDFLPPSLIQSHQSTSSSLSSLSFDPFYNDIEIIILIAETSPIL